MNSKGQARKAAEAIWRCWQNGTVLQSLPADIRPADRIDGYAIQAHFGDLSGQPIFGWKIAATSVAGQQHIGVEGPIAGRLLREHVFDDGATLAFGHNRLAVAEPEFAFHMKDDLPPRATEYTLNEAMAAVGALHPAIEVPDSRFDPVERAGAGQLIADNACTHDFVLGPSTPELWRDIDLSKHEVRISIDGKGTNEGIGANVLGDPRTALTWIANELSRHGIGLKAGHVVTTGTCATPIPVAPGDSVIANFGTLGTVTTRFAAS
jgi:2-keto-4-pentenoate hydratase